MNQSPKVFCIGRNKTGTSSLAKALMDWGYKLGNQRKGELLIKEYSNAQWEPIIDFCKSAEAFQDVPFSCPFTWLFLYHAYPDSKFILSTRNEILWYNSLVTFHAKLFSKDGVSPPTSQELKQASYRYEGFMWDENRAVWNIPEDDLYNKELMIHQYQLHNEGVRNFFKDKNNFIELDVSDADAYIRLARFLDKKPLYAEFPHVNKTADILKQ